MLIRLLIHKGFEEWSNPGMVRSNPVPPGILIQEMIWQRSAGSLILHGPPKICKFIEKCYSAGGKLCFDISILYSGHWIFFSSSKSCLTLGYIRLSDCQMISGCHWASARSEVVPMNSKWCPCPRSAEPPTNPSRWKSWRMSRMSRRPRTHHRFAARMPTAAVWPLTSARVTSRPWLWRTDEKCTEYKKYEKNQPEKNEKCCNNNSICLFLGQTRMQLTSGQTLP